MCTYRSTWLTEKGFVLRIDERQAEGKDYIWEKI